jgi:hypothetical protein
MHFDWFPFDAFSDVKFLARGGFATVFTATLETITMFDDNKKIFTVVLKKIGKRITDSSLNEVCRCVLSLCDG